MSVDTTHPQYDAYRWRWQRCRDVIAGRDAILQNGRSGQRFVGSLFDPVFTQEIYLPRLAGQTEPQYRSYAERAAFFNATGRTLDALTGMIFAKDPQWELPTAIERFAEDITLTATNLREFSEQVVEEQIAVGRVGIMVDYPENVPTNVSVAEAEARNIRPFLRHYKAESIINWRTASINGAKVLVLVVLREEHDVQVDEFNSETATRYRVLDMTPEGYRVRVMTDEGDLISETFPLMQGRSIGFIPFVILGANSCDQQVQKPPLLDLVDTNIAHYRNSADYEHGVHFTGLPTPYVAGVQLSEGQSLNLGSMTAWVFPDPSAKAEFLEFKGDGLKAIREAMKDKEHRMAVLGARMLADDKKTTEAFGTVELKTAGERSILASISRSASDAITRCLNFMAMWVGAPQDCRFSLNTDFGAARMQPQMLQQLVAAYQSDAIPLSVLFENLQRGEIVSPDMEFEEYQTQLEDEGPSFDAPSPDDSNDDIEQDQGIIATIRQRMGLS